MTIGPSLDALRKQKKEMDELLGAMPKGRLSEYSRNFPQETIELAEAILEERPVLMGREDVWEPALKAAVAELLKEREALREEVEELESRYDNLLGDVGGTGPG